MSQAPRSCNEIQANLPLFVGDDLEQPVLDEVRSHLASCPDCSARDAAARKARAALLRLQAQVQVEEKSEDLDLWPALRERLRAEGLLGDLDLDRKAPAAARSMVSVQPSVQRRVSAGTVWRLAGALTAAAALVLFFGPGRTPSVVETVPSMTPQVTVGSRPAQVTNPLPVGLRKAGPLDERLSEQAVPLRFWMQPKQRIPIHVGENVMAGSGVR